MVSNSQKLTDGLIIYSVLVSDYEKLDFKNDALAGVRANYFNSNQSLQQDKTDITVNDVLYNLSYSMQKDMPLSWKIIHNNIPVQTVKKATGGIYCVIHYSNNNIVNKREYFDKDHNWVRTEYYSNVYENVLIAVVSVKKVCGIVALNYIKLNRSGKSESTLLFPSKSVSKNKPQALIYSNVGMLWYDSSFIPSDYKEPQAVDNEVKSGFNFSLTDFDNQIAECKVDLHNAEYLECEECENTVAEDTELLVEEEPQPYTAYEKIEHILAEAHKTNKDLFGEIINQTSDDNLEPNETAEIKTEDNIDLEPIQEIIVDEDTEGNSEENHELFDSVEEVKVIEDTDDESTESIEEVVLDSVEATADVEDETKSVEENPANEDVTIEAETKTGIVEGAEEYEQKPQPPCNVIINNKSGKYTYYGDFDENYCRVGRGRTVTPEGLTSYDGEYKDDKRNGFGVCYYKEGNINYIGNWNNGIREGSGVGYRLSDGTMHAGKWSDNKPDGFGARFDSEGNFIDVGIYSKGVKNGKSVSFDKSGNVVIKYWQDGELISERVIIGDDN